jgi:hypothetical protein
MRIAMLAPPWISVPAPAYAGHTALAMVDRVSAPLVHTLHGPPAGGLGTGELPRGGRGPRVVAARAQPGRRGL